MIFPKTNEDYGITQEKGPTFEKEGRVRISKEVISQIATQALLKVIGVRAADHEGGQGYSQGVSISVEESGEPSVIVDTFIETKYGLRIPDIVWYVQESVKTALEQNTGYKVKAVNVYVQAIFIEEVRRPGQVLMRKDRAPVISEEAPDKEALESDMSVEKPAEEAFIENKPVEEAHDGEKTVKKEKSSIFGESRFPNR